MKILLLIPFLLLCVLATAMARSSLSDSQCPTPQLKNGRIRARGRGRIIRYSCYADYELVGNKYSTCIRGSWDTPTPICVSTRCATIPAPKHAVVGEKYRGAILMYFCEPGYQLVGNSEIYCDGRQWNGTTPYCRDTNAVAPTSCDFEKEGLCWWEQDPKHDFDWIRHRFDTPSSHIGTGPTHDHTLGPGSDGYYLYIEASGRLINDTARIISPLYNANLTEFGCFSFWYHMYGVTMGSLNVYFKLENEQTPKLMWTKQGNQGNQWLHASFELPTANSSFQIVMEGVRGSSYVSDIAIDDLAILQGDECALKNVTTSASPMADGDEVEIFNAIQSCKGRCSLVETTPSSELYSNPDVCQCTTECAESSSCCPDYAEYCVYEFTDAMETIIPSSMASSTVTTSISESITRQSPSRSEEAATTEQSLLPSSSTVQQTSDKPSQTTATTTTTTWSATSTTTIATLPSQSVAFTIPRSKERITRPETKPTTTPTTTTTSSRHLYVLSTKRIDFLSTAAEPHIIVQNAQQLEPESSFHVSGIIGITIGTLMAAVITATLALLVLRRRKYKRPSNGSPFADDSDVRYLTSDEQLDFNLARPADDC